MPEKKTLEERAATSAGKVGEHAGWRFVREEIHHVRDGSKGPVPRAGNGSSFQGPPCRVKLPLQRGRCR